MSKVKATIAALRRAFPFSTVNASSMLDVPELKNVSEAVRYYQRPKDFFYSEAYLRLHQRADYHGAAPELRLFTWRFMRALRARGLPFYVHTCFRHPDVQAELVEKGFSKTRFGPHQRGSAVDIVSAIDHWEIPDDLWYYVGTLGEEVARGTPFGEGRNGGPLKIEWGGRWSFYDPAHWQLSDHKSRPKVEAHPRKLLLNPYADQMRFG